jgi:gliding motility-associated-like protein
MEHGSTLLAHVPFYVMKSLLFILPLVSILVFVSCKKYLNEEYCDCANSTITLVVDTTSLSIPTIITPNGDGNNDFWIISGLENFAQSNLVIQRTGLFHSKIFEASPYLNNWDGGGLKNGKYQYSLTINNQKIEGYICIYDGTDDGEYDYSCIKYNNVIDPSDPVLH